ncbi:MAG: hypothetical protein H5T61_11585 [Thermoflexales bacterium]|nr:hypothetical protein [Thermoflexales bacterium]
MEQLNPIDAFEQQIHNVASHFSFIQQFSTLDKTAHTIKLRLYITTDCFVQIYANVRKNIVSYALVLSQNRIYGRNCYDGVWHRHPYEAPETHDFGPDGCRQISLEEFLIEVQQILEQEELL